MIRGRPWVLGAKIYLCSIHVMMQVLLILRGTIPPKGKQITTFSLQARQEQLCRRRTHGLLKRAVVIDQNTAHLDDRSLARLRKLGLDLIVVSPFDIR
jgi:hypothetical protein